MTSEKDYEKVWSKCLEVIKDVVTPEMYQTWFMPIVPIGLEDDARGPVLILRLPSQYYCDHLENHFSDILRRTIKKELGPSGRLRYNIIMGMDENKKPIVTITLPSQGTKKQESKPVSLPRAIGMPEAGKITNPLYIPGTKRITIHSQLNESWRLENFVEGDCNRLARSAGFSIAQNPGKTAFNPLLIYGNSGLGKSHLATAIGWKTKELHSDKVVLYVTSDQFMRQYSTSTQDNTTNDFIHFYECIDVLIIDDIHFWENRAPKTQEAFFQIFNHLHQQKKQIIITSDKAPSELSGIEERLVNRLKWGLQADLQIPDVETRINILKQKLAQDGIEMPYSVIEHIAYNINTNVRELEGALVTLMAQSSLNKKEITFDLAKQMIEKFVKNTSRDITIDYIQKVVCDYFNLSVESMQSRTRKREIVQARQLAMYFAKQYTKSPLSMIGLQCGNKDHATVLHACKTVSNLIETDKQFRSWAEDISKKIKQ
ncbi:MAG: chromosomal replication initiator protein DnaA [Bacteroidales bacterium]|nr:chromosomal replication initiator protein DnaA [Bacteroidales bacterium]